MADTPPHYLRNYDAFYNKLMTKFDAMAEVAHSKNNLENLSVPSSIPFWGKDVGEPRIGEARDALGDYVVSHLSGDWDALDELKSTLNHLKVFLIGHNGESPETTFSGITDNIGTIQGGISSWANANSTGQIFKKNYVDTISQRATYQYGSLKTSVNAIAGAQDLLVKSRKAVLNLPDESKKALEDYSPINDSLIGTAKVTLSTIGCFVAPAPAALIVATLETLPAESELTVSTLMGKFIDAIEHARKRKAGGEKEARHQIKSDREKEADKWENYVCSRPESQS